MYEIKLCPECKAPELFTAEHIWLNNGDIVSSRDQRSRLAFLECENLDPLFANIGEIIGMPIERMIINITARGVRAYLSQLIPEEVKSVLLGMKPGDAVLRERCRQLIDPLTESNIMLARIMGYGRYDHKGYRYERDEKDFSIVRVTTPYSVPLVVGSHIGNNAALVGGQTAVDYEEISPGVYELTAHWAAGDEALEERLKIEEYVHKDGDVELERCGTCGGPAVFSGYEWDLDRGIIRNTFTGRRMAMMGPSMLDPIFEELEAELGEAIPRAVVEAQRRFVKTGFYSIEEVRDEGDMRTQYALRGLGNLREIEMGKKGVRIRMDNTALHLVVVGLVQGLFDMAFGMDSKVEWELSEGKDLQVEVTPR